MKLLRKIIRLVLVFILGFWVASAGILEETATGEVLEKIVTYLPDRNTIDRFLDSPWRRDQQPQENLNSKPINNNESPEVHFKSESHEINYDLIESTIVDLTNALRKEQSLSALSSNDALKAGAYVRAEELEESFSHTRPDGSDAFTVFQTESLFYPYKMVGENLAMGTYYLPEEEMAQLLFEGWVKSDGHYENMVRQEYAEVGVGVHYDGKFLYLTQLFGTPRY